ncbi:uncharacterized protein G2W53_016411 [Senna tora]|uniref:Secreted protein n=1 Tax=Senna tora TaxID=362788 RepID=A0A834WJI4_9FABA|nr:uncharacterized protein G2W53_016411 [Senna tora]
MKAGSAKLLPWLPSTLLSPTLSLSSLARTQPRVKKKVKERRRKSDETDEAIGDEGCMVWGNGGDWG